jgi:hypothetical protein
MRKLDLSTFIFVARTVTQVTLTSMDAALNLQVPVTHADRPNSERVGRSSSVFGSPSGAVQQSVLLLEE